MDSTTFDYARALAADHGGPRAHVDGKPAVAVMEALRGDPAAPGGGAWSNVPDMLRTWRWSSRRASCPRAGVHRQGGVLARRAAQVPIGKNETYGMGCR